jgi:hypothetical protein
MKASGSSIFPQDRTQYIFLSSLVAHVVIPNLARAPESPLIAGDARGDGTVSRHTHASYFLS